MHLFKRPMVAYRQGRTIRGGALGARRTCPPAPTGATLILGGHAEGVYKIIMMWGKMKNKMLEDHSMNPFFMFFNQKFRK